MFSSVKYCKEIKLSKQGKVFIGFGAEELIGGFWSRSQNLLQGFSMDTLTPRYTA